MLIVTGSGAWYPAHMGRTFGWSASQIGLTLGITVTAAGLLSQSISGRIMDAMFRRGIRDAQFRWYAGCLVAAAPLGIIAMTSANPWVFTVCIGLFLALISSYSACAATSLNLVTPNELRGTGIAFWAATSGLIGAAAGPMLIALVRGAILQRAVRHRLRHGDADGNLLSCRRRISVPGIPRHARGSDGSRPLGDVSFPRCSEAKISFASLDALRSVSRVLRSVATGRASAKPGYRRYFIVGIENSVRFSTSRGQRCVTAFSRV